MSRRTVFLQILSILFGGALGVGAQTSPPVAIQTSGPAQRGKIQFEQPIFDFGKIKSGEIVKHSFILTNIGSETLEITHVQPSCGCTTAGDWTRKVEPGQTGTIPIQFNSHNFSGQVFKTVTVSSSASTQPSVLQIKGEIWKPIDISPQFAVINVPPDSGGAGSVSVKIINNTSESLTLAEPEVNNRSFKASITQSTNNPKEYVMTISTVPPLPSGSVQGQITVRTGSTNAPTVTVTAWANVQPAFVVLPGQITLPAGPLAGPVTPSVLVQNNSTNPLSITEPTINVPDIKIDVRETQPGKQYSIALTFPKGYENKPGEQVLFTAKTSNDSLPTIRIPVAQMPRSLAPPPAHVPQPASAPAAPQAASTPPRQGPPPIIFKKPAAPPALPPAPASPETAAH